MRKKISKKSLIVFVFFVTGCTALTSEIGYQDGVPYYLPKSIVTIEVAATSRVSDSPTPRKYNYSMKVSSEAIADVNQRYVISYKPNRFSDDRLCVARNNSGLLREVEFASDDKTPEILFDLARFAKALQAPVPAAFRQDQVRDKSVKVLPPKFTRTFNPFDPFELQSLNQALSDHFDEDISVQFPGLTHMPKSSNLSEANRLCNTEHICFRTKIKAPIALTHDRWPDNYVDVKYTDIINPLDLGAISVSRAMFVEKVTRLKFDDNTGTLSGLVLRKPSEVEAAARLPLDILQIILATPLNALINPAGADLPEEIHDPSPAINNAEEDGNNDLFKLKCTYSIPKSG